MLPMTAFDAARSVLATLRRAGHEAWLVGGCVRDVKRGIAPEAIAEFDVATSALPDEVMPLFRASVPVGRAFGIVRVRAGGHWFEVATFRSGRESAGERGAGVHEDAAHRDFTINAMYWDPESGNVQDPVAGGPDVEAGLVRAVADPAGRFAEDPLRVLRAVRFGSWAEFRLEDATRAAMAAHVPALSGVSAERIRDELLKIAHRPESRRGDALRLLCGTGILDRVFAPGPSVRDVEAAARVLDSLPLRTLPLLLAAVFRHALKDGSPPGAWRALALRISERLRAPAAEAAVLGDLLADRSRYRALGQRRRARQVLAATRPGREEHEDLLRAEGDAPAVLALLDGIRAATGSSRPAPLLDGKVLIAAGIRPGPRLGWILRRARILQLDGTLETTPDALRRFVSR